jgi:hypothetical protein
MDFLEDFQLVEEYEEIEEIENLVNERRSYQNHNRFFHKNILNTYDNVDFIARYRLHKPALISMFA